MKSIGFIGTGVMGCAMAENLMKNGFQLYVYTRTREKARPLTELGAHWCETAAQCAAGRQAVITMVGYPRDVEEIYFGSSGIIAAADRGTYLIDMTTSDPLLAQRIFAAAGERGLHALDAPVSGGDTGARAGTLSIMVGGEKADFDACGELFRAMGKTIIHEGAAGCGQHTKMANQIAIAGAIAGVCEAIAYGRDKGLDLQTMLNSIGSGAAGSFQMTYNGQKIINGDNSAGFFLKHFVKDMTIAASSAQADGLTLPVLEQVLSMYKKLEERGLGQAGTQALIEYYK